MVTQIGYRILDSGIDSHYFSVIDTGDIAQADCTGGISQSTVVLDWSGIVYFLGRAGDWLNAGDLGILLQQFLPYLGPLVSSDGGGDVFPDWLVAPMVKLAFQATSGGVLCSTGRNRIYN